MGTFFKAASLALEVVGGSLLFLWLAFIGRLPLAWLTLACMAVLSVALIMLLREDAKRAPLGPRKTRLPLDEDTELAHNQASE